MKVDGRDIDFKNFAGNSYIMGAMILMMARRNQRKILEENWRKITYVQMNEFMPDHPEDIFAWRIKEGTNHSEFPKIAQSWAELQKEAMNFDGAPQLFTERLDLLYFFILACPHRATKLITGLLDDGIKI